jgi:hypothetical protein
MDEEPFFLVDEELLELESILTEVQFQIDNPDLDHNKMILRSFIRACVKASKIKVPEKIVTKQPEFTLPKPPTPTKKKKLFRIIKQTRKAPAGTDVFPIPSPSFKRIKKFKTVPKFKREKIRVKLPLHQIPLIQDNVTNKPLAIADIQDKYIVKEPGITLKEISIIKTIISKKPESPREAWKLVQRLARDIPEDKQTNLKYYIINSLFALGRLEPLFHDKRITEISCEGVGQVNIKRDDKSFKTNILFSDKEDLDSYMKKIAKKLERTLNESNPIIDTVSKNFRFHLMLGLHGASSRFNIRKIE